MEPQTQSPPQQEQPQPKDPVAAALERLGPQLDEAKAQLDLINVKVKTFVKENPGASLLAAIAVGFVVGRLVSKK